MKRKACNFVKEAILRYPEGACRETAFLRDGDAVVLALPATLTLCNTKGYPDTVQYKTVKHHTRDCVQAGAAPLFLFFFFFISTTHRAQKKGGKEKNVGPRKRRPSFASSFFPFFRPPNRPKEKNSGKFANAESLHTF
jgi:hypothetical protein